MLRITSVALGLLPLTLALPQGQTAQPSSNAANAQVTDAAHTPYSGPGVPYDVHPYIDQDATAWAADGVSQYSVLFCNRSETRMIRNGLREAEILAAHARDHIHRWGNTSSYFTKYFGSAGTAEPAGWFDKIVNGDKTGVVIRCDDPDGTCALEPDWGGYWRGTNGTNENNICPLSFEERWSLDQMCMHGYTVAGWTYVQFWASDLHHRLFHTPAVGEGLVNHYADDYGPAVELAKTDPAEAVRNTHSLALFALDVYAYDIAVPGRGCTGMYVAEEEEEEEDIDSATDSPAEATATADAAVTTTESSAEECHIHSDTGEIHCV